MARSLIGDLSSIALCSVPPKPSNYLQRVGRSGRVNGNSFVLAAAGLPESRQRHSFD